MAAERWRRATVATLTALALLEILWEVWLAPVKPGGSWLALKCLPLLLLWPGVARGALRAYQWTLLLPWYLAEGLVRAFSEKGRHAFVAFAAAALALACVTTGLGYVRALRAQR